MLVSEREEGHGFLSFYTLVTLWLTNITWHWHPNVTKVLLDHKRIDKVFIRPFTMVLKARFNMWCSCNGVLRGELEEGVVESIQHCWSLPHSATCWKCVGQNWSV